ncbi:FecR family protein [Chitinophaga sp. HK235]|uniref:FecR family protein n=1 Tax=Chitinophaga sp. HK235 TaxID=2952571 RepID=UPI001BAC53EB|nr:FecR domain-containing protein [Chitinophaga sp. HK235]
MQPNYSNGQMDDLITQFLSGNISTEDQRALEEWIDASPDNRAYFTALRDVWMATATPGHYTADAAWHELQQINAPVSIKRWKQVLRMAASFTLPFVLGGGVVFAWLSLKKGDNGQGLVTVTSPKGATTKIELSDGTEVWLNAGSSLQYASSFNNHSREVKLEGEAFFKVHTDSRKPFTVNAADLKILALGTSFNVKAYPEDKGVVTTLVDGAVRIDGSQTASPFKIMLKPHQHVVYKQPATITGNNQKGITAGTAASITPVETREVSNTEIYTAWKDGNWIVTSQSLEELAITMERRFNVNVIFKDEALKTFRFSGTFRQETLEQVLNILKLTAPLDYKIEEGTVTIREDKALKEKYANALRNGK